MPYATQTDLLQRMTLTELTQLTDDAGAGTPDEDVVNGVLAEASAKVEGYTRDKYQAPLQTSAEVTAITRDIAVYLLFTRRPGTVRESVRQRYDDAIALLKDVSVGKATLDQPAGATQQTILAGPVTPCDDHRRFTHRNLEGLV